MSKTTDALAALEQGTATPEQITDLKNRIKGNSKIKKFVKGHLDDVNPNSQIEDVTLAGIASGKIIPNARYSGLQSLRAFESNKEGFAELQRNLLLQDIELQREFLPQLMQAQNDLIAEFGPQLAQLEKDLRPEDTALREELQSQIREELERGSQLDPELRRTVEQGVRGAQSARGTLLGNAAETAEGFAVGERGLALRNQRQSKAADLLRLNASTRPDPIATILGRNTVANPNATLSNNVLSPFVNSTFQQQNQLQSVPFNADQAAIQRAHEAQLGKNQGSKAGVGALLGGGLALGAGLLTGGMGLPALGSLTAKGAMAGGTTGSFF